MRYILSILTIFLFTGAAKRTEETRSPWHRSFYAEMKKLEKPERVQAFSLVQTANNYITGTSGSVTISSSGSNNLLVVSIWILSTNSISSVSDNASNTYASAQNFTSASERMAVYYAFQTTSGATSVTVAVSSSTSYVVIVDEYSGFTGTPTNAECYDASNGQAHSGGAGNSTSGNFSPINYSCLIVGAMGDGNCYGDVTVGSGFSAAGSRNVFGSCQFLTEYKTSSTIPDAAIFYHPSNSSVVVAGVSFKQEDAAPPPAAGKAIRSAGN